MHAAVHVLSVGAITRCGPTPLLLQEAGFILALQRSSGDAQPI